jgi:hypothetical protein
MLNIDSAALQSSPFPHLAQRNLLDPEMYGELKATFPEFDTAVGWHRMSKDLMRGDPGFTEAVSHGAWKGLYGYLNSSFFLTAMVELFHEGLQSDDFLANPNALKLTDHVETRDWIGGHNVGRAISDFRGALEDVFIRMDFGIGELGYSRRPHLDWRHRICSMLMYFDNPQETKMEGGRFLVHDNTRKDSPVIASLEPENNMGILKLDNNQSLHSVNEVTAIEGQRKTLFIGVSSRGRVWRH